MGETFGWENFLPAAVFIGLRITTSFTGFGTESSEPWNNAFWSRSARPGHHQLTPELAQELPPSSR